MLQILHTDITQCVEDKGEKTLHICCSQPVQLVVLLCQGEGIFAPAAFIKRDGIGVAAQQQTAVAIPETREQIELTARFRNGLHLDIKPQGFKPGRQQIDNSFIALIRFRFRGTDGRCRDELTINLNKCR